MPELVDSLSLESEWQSTQVYRTLLSILPDFNKAIVWIFSILLLIKKILKFYFPSPSEMFQWLASLRNCISTFAGYLMPKPEQWRYNLTHSWEDKGVHNFPKGICVKVNVIARLEFELTYYDSGSHCFNHYTTHTPPNCFKRTNNWHLSPFNVPPFFFILWQSLSLNSFISFSH